MLFKHRNYHPMICRNKSVSSDLLIRDFVIKKYPNFSGLITCQYPELKAQSANLGDQREILGEVQIQQKLDLYDYSL